jgi:hypothetical protein
MQKRTVGIIFLCIASFLYGVRYLSAAIYGSNASSWSPDLFKMMLYNVGDGPLLFSRLAFIVGILYFIVGEFEAPIKRTLREIRDNWNRDIE